jgi:hypothetical protein
MRHRKANRKAPAKLLDPQSFDWSTPGHLTIIGKDGASVAFDLDDLAHLGQQAVRVLLAKRDAGSPRPIHPITIRSVEVSNAWDMHGEFAKLEIEPQSSLAIQFKLEPPIARAVAEKLAAAADRANAMPHPSKH